jgi:hypothetical protein
MKAVEWLWNHWICFSQGTSGWRGPCARNRLCSSQSYSHFIHTASRTQCKLSGTILDAPFLLTTLLHDHLGTLSLNHIIVFIQQQNMLGINAKQHGPVNHLSHAQSTCDHDIILKGHCAHSPRSIRTAFTVPQLVKKFPTFFFTVLTTAHQWSLSWARIIQSTSSNLTSVRTILIHLPFYSQVF